MRVPSGFKGFSKVGRCQLGSVSVVMRYGFSQGWQLVVYWDERLDSEVRSQVERAVALFGGQVYPGCMAEIGLSNAESPTDAEARAHNLLAGVDVKLQITPPRRVFERGVVEDVSALGNGTKVLVRPRGEVANLGLDLGPQLERLRCVITASREIGVGGTVSMLLELRVEAADDPDYLSRVMELLPKVSDEHLGTPA